MRSDQPKAEALTPIDPATLAFEAGVIALASQSHQGWRNGRLDGEAYKPRFVPTTDEAWIEANGDRTDVVTIRRSRFGSRVTTLVDIANLSFEDLPSDRQADTLASADAAMREAYWIGFFNAPDSEPYVDFSSSAVHRDWVSKHPKAPRAQKASFEGLLEPEKDKDREFVNGAMRIVNDRKAAGTFAVPQAMLKEWINDDVSALRDLGRTILFGAMVSGPLFAGGQVEMTLRILEPGGGVEVEGRIGIKVAALALHKLRQTFGDTRAAHKYSHSEAIGAFANLLAPETAN